MRRAASRVGAFLGAAVAVALALQALALELSLHRLLLAVFLLVLTFSLLFLVTARALSGRRAVQAVVVLVWLTALPFLSPMSPSPVYWSAVVAFALLGLLLSVGATRTAALGRVAADTDDLADSAPLGAWRAAPGAHSGFLGVVALIGVPAALLLAFRVVAPGPDFDSYARYLSAFTEGDLLHEGALEISVHSIGPALLWAPFFLLFEALGITDETRPDLLYATLPNWLAFVGLLLSQTCFLRRRGFAGPEIAVGLGASYFGTPLVYYGVFSVASEMPSALSVWAIFRRLADGPPRDLEAWTTLGALSGLAVLIRPNNALVLLPVLTAVAADEIRRDPRLGLLGLLGLACLVGMLPTLILNVLFFGSPFRSPYTYRLASGEYLWFNFADVKALETLFSHWHGVLLYSPLYLIAVAGVALYVQRDMRRLRVSAGRFWQRPLSTSVPYLIGIYFLVHFYVVAASRTWWMGTGTLGGRQFVNFAPFAALAVVYLLARARASRWHGPLIGLTLAASLWSFLLMLQRETNFTRSYAEVWTAQLAALTDRAAFAAFPIVAATAAVLLAAAARPHPGRPVPDALVVVAVLVWSAALYFTCIAAYPEDRDVDPRGLVAAAILLLGGMGLLVRFVWRARPAGVLARLLAVAWFLVIVVLPIKAGLASGGAERDFGAYLDSLWESVREYEEIPGYAREKIEWRQIIDTFEESLRREDPPVPDRLRAKGNR